VISMSVRYVVVGILLWGAMSRPLAAQVAAEHHVDSSPSAADSPRDVLSADEWQRVDDAAARALAWLASTQQPDGSFATDQYGQPGVTGLVTLAFLAWGHEPGSGRYGTTIDRALGYIVGCQRKNGLICLMGPDGPLVPNDVKYVYSVPGTYNHAIGGLTLSEAYGITGQQSGPQTRRAIERALRLSLEIQRWDRSPRNAGGWRYLSSTGSDLSVAGWHLMFLRSARNAGFEVPSEPIDHAVEFVLRCFAPEHQTFEYDAMPQDRRTRAMAGAGILALAHAGMHDRPEAVQAAEWILKHGFEQYNRAAYYGPEYRGDRYHYGVFYCCQAMYQMGGQYWEEFFPPTAAVLLANQNPDGSWAEESNKDTRFGRTYTTALVLLALGAPNQLLPIFQR
jgi:Prenyltransferase and squalene oxidase repeat